MSLILRTAQAFVFNSPEHRQHTKLVEASVELGHSFNPDAYSGHNAGVFYSLSSQTPNAVRDSSEFAYCEVLERWSTVVCANNNPVDPVISRPNLIVLSHALVTKMNIPSGYSSQVSASGVKVRFPDGSLADAKVKPENGEVILSAGTIRTPQLLELSGVGDPQVLTPLGIDVKVNLPGVGRNFEDQ